MPEQDKERSPTFPPILRVIFPEFSDEELIRANDSLAEFFSSVYVRYQNDIEKAVADRLLDN